MGAPGAPLDASERADHRLSSGHEPHGVTQPDPHAAAHEPFTLAVHPYPVTVADIGQVRSAQPLAVGVAGIEPAGLPVAACDVSAGGGADGVTSPA